MIRSHLIRAAVSNSNTRIASPVEYTAAASTETHGVKVSLPTAAVSLILNGGSRGLVWRKKAILVGGSTGLIKHIDGIQHSGYRTRVTLHLNVAADTETHSPEVTLPTAAKSLVLDGGARGMITRNWLIETGPGEDALPPQPIVFFSVS